MIIANSSKFIFIHIHKTGGTSVTRALEPALKWNDIICGGSRSGDAMEEYMKARFGLEKHSDAASVRAIVGDDVWNEYTTFAFVRSPYKRMVSLYTWLGQMIRARGFRRYLRALDRRPEIWEWPGVRAHLQSADFPAFIRNETLLSHAPGAIPMVDRLSDNGELLVDFVGKLENMADDFQQFCQLAGLSGLGIEKHNTTKKKSELASFYRSQDDLDYVFDRFKADFDTFGYERLRHGEL